MSEVNSYDGPGFVGAGVQAPKRRDGVKLSHRSLMNRFIEIGNEQLNLNDYNRTSHLPLGRGRLACDPETGEFDKDAPRPIYSATKSDSYPRHVHSKITQGEYREVHDKAEHEEFLSTNKWSDTPLERKRVFTLTPEDQMASMKAQLEAERYSRIQLEQRLEGAFHGDSADAVENQNLHSREIAELKAANEALNSRLQQLMTMMEEKLTSPVEVGSKKK